MKLIYYFYFTLFLFMSLPFLFYLFNEYKNYRREPETECKSCDE